MNLITRSTLNNYQSYLPMIAGDLNSNEFRSMNIFDLYDQLGIIEEPAEEYERKDELQSGDILNDPGMLNRHQKNNVI